MILWPTNCTTNHQNAHVIVNYFCHIWTFYTSFRCRVSDRHWWNRQIDTRQTDGQGSMLNYPHTRRGHNAAERVVLLTIDLCMCVVYSLLVIYFLVDGSWMYIVCTCAVCRSCIVRHLSNGNGSCPRCGPRSGDTDCVPRTPRIRSASVTY